MNEDKLEAYERMQAHVEEEFACVTEQMEHLRAADKVKTATYKQLFARKMTLSSFLDTYRTFGLL